MRDIWDEWIATQRSGIAEDRRRIESGEELERIIGWREYRHIRRNERMKGERRENGDDD